MEYIASIDAVISLIAGAIIGGIANKVMKGFGSIGNIVTGLVGALMGGLFFDRFDFMNVGDIADPAIAGLVGSVILLAIVRAFRG